MADVRNNHDAVVSVGGVSIRPGATSRVPNWTRETANEKERALLDIGAIEVIEEPKAKADDKQGQGKKAS